MRGPAVCVDSPSDAPLVSWEKFERKSMEFVLRESGVKIPTFSLVAARFGNNSGDKEKRLAFLQI
uniref:Uncharacterized protein n=1 Tax=Globisporangium ultimum (strain ATCC 200006 / CBS 805.95 / DAOM BR144) TaxID=431595 RepID=K3X3L9_GLOUD